MKIYILQFTQTMGDEKVMSHWKCQADDVEHAVEQLIDEVEHAEGETLIDWKLVNE
jgi:hypothetical protein